SRIKFINYHLRQYRYHRNIHSQFMQSSAHGVLKHVSQFALSRSIAAIQRKLINLLRSHFGSDQLCSHLWPVAVSDYNLMSLLKRLCEVAASGVGVFDLLFDRSALSRSDQRVTADCD